MKGKMRERVLLYRLHTHNDPDAFAELYDIYVARIYRFVFFKVKTHEDAQDIVSEVFLKAWHYVTEHKEMHNFHALLYRIARNEVIDYYRTRKETESLENIKDVEAEQAGGKNGQELPLYTLSPTATVAGQGTEAGLSAELISALGKLKDEYKEVLTLRFVDSLEISEIAEILGKSNVSVRVTQHRALKALGKILEQ